MNTLLGCVYADTIHIDRRPFFFIHVWRCLAIRQGCLLPGDGIISLPFGNLALGIEGSRSPVCGVRRVATRTYNDNSNAHFSFLPLRPSLVQPRILQQPSSIPSIQNNGQQYPHQPTPAHKPIILPSSHSLPLSSSQTNPPRSTSTQRSQTKSSCFAKGGRGTHVETRDPGENESFERALGWENSQEGYGGGCPKINSSAPHQWWQADRGFCHLVDPVPRMDIQLVE